MRLTPMACVLLSACTTVTTMDGREIDASSASNCDVRIYQTHQSAIARGPIDEVCVVRGNSSYRLPHTVPVAIEKNKQYVCACGAQNAYIQSATESALDVAYVTLVAFHYSKNKKPD